MKLHFVTGRRNIPSCTPLSIEKENTYTSYIENYMNRTFPTLKFGTQLIMRWHLKAIVSSLPLDPAVLTAAIVAAAVDDASRFGGRH